MTLHRVALTAAAAALVLIPSASTYAQEIGVKAGVNFAKLTPEEDDEPDIDNRVGFVGGGFIRFPITAGFSFQAEGLYSEQGAKFTIPRIEDFPGGNQEIRLRYFQVPLLARGDFGASGSPARFFVVGGLVPSFNVAADASLEIEGEDDVSRDIDDAIKPFDLGLAGGVGVAFGNGVIEARYTHGLLHINEDDNGDEDRIRNRVFSVTVGFRFR